MLPFHLRPQTASPSAVVFGVPCVQKRSTVVQGLEEASCLPYSDSVSCGILRPFGLSHVPFPAELHGPFCWPPGVPMEGVTTVSSTRPRVVCCRVFGALCGVRGAAWAPTHRLPCMTVWMGCVPRARVPGQTVCAVFQPEPLA